MPATQRVQRDRSSRPKALFALEAQQLLARGEARQAVELCKRGLAYYPANPTGYVVLAQSYIQLDEKDRALNVLQDGYRRTGSDRLSELALELAGERPPTSKEEGTEQHAVTVQEPGTADEASAEIDPEAGIGAMLIEEIAVEEMYPLLADPAVEILIETASPEPAGAAAPAHEDAVAEIGAAGDEMAPILSPEGPESAVPAEVPLMEAPPAAEMGEEPVIVEDEVIAMEIEIAEIEPEKSEAPGVAEYAEGIEEPSPEPGIVIMPEMEAVDVPWLEPATDSTPDIIEPAAGPYPDEFPATVPGDEIYHEPEVDGEAEPAEPETIPETAPVTEEPSADTADVAVAGEIPAPPTMAEELSEPSPEAMTREESEKEVPAEQAEVMPPLAVLAPLAPVEAIAPEPEPAAEMTSVPEEEISTEPPAENAEPAAIVPEIHPAEDAAAEAIAAEEPVIAEPIDRTEIAEPAPPLPEQPRPEPSADSIEGTIEVVEPEPAATTLPPDAAGEEASRPTEHAAIAAEEPVASGPQPPAPAAVAPAMPNHSEVPATEPSVQEEPAQETVGTAELPAPPEAPRMPEFAPLSVRSHAPGGEEQVTTGRRENIVQLGSQQPPPLHTAEPPQPALQSLRTLEGRGRTEGDLIRGQGGAMQGTVQERSRPLALHMGKNIARLRSSNLRLIPGLEFAPLRHEDQTRRQSIAPLISEPMPMPVADSSARAQRTQEEKELNLPPLPPLVDAGPSPEGLRIGEREPEALPLQAPELVRQEEPPATEEIALPAAEESGIEEEAETIETPEFPFEPEAAGEADPFAGNILQMVQAVQKASELTPLEELARRLENARIPVVEEVTEHRPVFTTSIVSETLANILVSQGAFAEALKAFQTLARTKPERFDYFQERIWEMKWRISNPDLPWPPEELSPEIADPTA